MSILYRSIDTTFHLCFAQSPLLISKSCQFIWLRRVRVRANSD